MEIVFESILLFSLAILVIAIGLLVYYFKKRIADIEQKNTKCLEIVHDVFVQHMQLKAEVAQSRIIPDFYQQQNQDDRIKIHLEENYDDADDDAYADDADDTDDVKIVNVDLSGRIDSDINITDEIDDQFDSDAQQSSTFEVLDAQEPDVFEITELDNQQKTITIFNCCDSV